MDLPLFVSSQGNVRVHDAVAVARNLIVVIVTLVAVVVLLVVVIVISSGNGSSSGSGSSSRNCDSRILSCTRAVRGCHKNFCMLILIFL